MLIFALSVTAMSRAGAIGPAVMKIPAPEIQGIDEWINTKPLSLKDLKGKVVVVHFWTFG
jgi:hypothetical protein